MDLFIKEESLQKAFALHQENPVADAHLDLAGEILLRTGLGEKDIIRNHYLKNWQIAGLNLIVSSVYVPTSVLEQGGIKGAWENALAQIEALKKDLAATQEVILVTDKKALKKLRREQGMGILLYMEGLDCIGEDVEKLEELYDMGVRGASLTWSRENALAKGCCRAGEKIQIRGGLTEKGIKAVEALERLSMFLDISHLNDDGFADVRQVAAKPFCATHSCAKSVYDNYRNLTDEQMEALAEQGGVMGLNGCKYIAGSLSGNHLEMLCRHAEYEVGKAGAAGVGFGFDLCDSYTEAERQLAQKLSGSARGKALPEKEDCFLSHAQIPLLTAALLERGMEEDTLKGILGGNFFRYFESTL